MGKPGGYIGEGRGFIYCGECGKIIGVSYNTADKEYVLHDCFCIECHNKTTFEQRWEDD